jgi:hypothetical protein
VAGEHGDPTLARGLRRLRLHRYGALVEALTEEPSFLVRSTFGGLSCYVHGRMQLALIDRRPPWRGLLVATSRESHASLIAELPALRVHPVLGKWLLLPEAADDFEDTAAALVMLVRRDDPRIGVESKPRRRSSRELPGRAAEARVRRRARKTGRPTKAPRRTPKAGGAARATQRSPAPRGAKRR